jgi:hypothetical protein
MAAVANANVKPLAHWAIYHGYSLRFRTRSAEAVTGILTTPQGPVVFRYDPVQRILVLPDATLRLNDYGWEVAGTETPEPHAKTPSRKEETEK